VRGYDVDGEGEGIEEREQLHGMEERGEVECLPALDGEFAEGWAEAGYCWGEVVGLGCGGGRGRTGSGRYGGREQVPRGCGCCMWV